MPEQVPDEVTPLLIAVVLVQVAMLLGGLAVLWRLYRRPEGAGVSTRPPALAPWRLPPSDFLFACLVVIVCGIGVQALFGLATGYFPAADTVAGKDLQVLIQGASFQLGMLLGAVIAGVSTRRRFPSETMTPPPVKPWIAGAAAFLAALPVVTLVNLAWVNLLQGFGVEPKAQELVEYFNRAESPVVVPLIMFFAVVVAPITEELIFRAGLFRYLRTRIPRWAALLLPALLFGALHGNFGALAPLAVLGIAFSLAYEYTGRISVPIIAHAFFNLNTTLLLLAGVTE